MVKFIAVFIIYLLLMAVAKVRGLLWTRLLKEMDKRVCIKLCIKNEIWKMKCVKRAYGESIMKKEITVYEQYKRFKDGCEDVEGDEFLRCFSTSLLLIAES